jgi:hypothetical protein
MPYNKYAQHRSLRSLDSQKLRFCSPASLIVSPHMKLHRARQLINDGIDRANPMGSLIHVLESAIELVSLPDNDFCWSSWESEQEAKQEMLALIGSVKAGVLPEKLKIAMLFAPTGPLQEVSMSSGWADAYLKIADRYDEVESILW